VATVTVATGGIAAEHESFSRFRQVAQRQCATHLIGYMVLWVHVSLPPNGISILSSVFAEITGTPNV